MKIVSFKEGFLAVILGMIFPLLIIAYLHFHGLSYLSGGEPSKYLKTVPELLNHGRFFYNYKGEIQPDLIRLVGYPFFITLIYKLFGVDNYLSVLIAQSILTGFGVLFLALSARILNQNWFWPTVFIAALWPNMAYQASIIMPETLFILFICMSIFFFLYSVHSNYFILLFVMGSVFMGLSLTVRPAGLLFPFTTFPFLCYLVYEKCSRSIFKSIMVSSLSLAIVGLILLPSVIRFHYYTGKYALTSQTGHHLLDFVYPCLAQSWGCGNANPLVRQQVKLLIQEKIQSLPDNEKNNVGIINQIQTRLAFQLISELPLKQLIKASVGSSVKMMFHTSFLKFIERHEIVPAHFSLIQANSFKEKVIKFMQIIMGNPWMQVWFVFQSLLIVSRIVQMIGLFSAIKTSTLRPAMLWLLIGAISFVVISVGIGNQRYRVPAEPFLVLATVIGIDTIRHWFSRKKIHKIELSHV